MAVRVPKETAYYYEISPRGTRIVLCLPRPELDRLVAAGEARHEIVTDYPDGLDFEVSQYELDYFRKMYGLRLDLDPGALQAAFAVFRGAATTAVPGTGFIRSEFLEDLSKTIQAAVKPREPSPARLPGKRIAEQRRVRRNALEQAQKVVADRVQVPERRWQIAAEEMSEGDDPAAVFTRVQQRVRKGR